MATAKEEIRKLLDSLPDDATFQRHAPELATGFAAWMLWNYRETLAHAGV